MKAHKATLDKHGLRPRKRFGQNFLVDEGYLDAIVKAADLSKDDTVLEIGAGLGYLTRKLSDKAGKVYAVEFDRDLAAALRQELKLGNVEIVEADALKLDYNTVAPSPSKIKAVANLPYNIATEIIFRMLDARERFSTLILMTQLEVAKRIVAEPGGKSYGVLSLTANLYADTSIALRVPPGAFRPKPNVDSAVVRFDVRESPRVKIADERIFKTVVKAAFGQRRKTLLNSLSSSPYCMGDRVKTLAWIERSGISPDLRPETLSMEQFAVLAENVPHE